MSVEDREQWDTMLDMPIDGLSAPSQFTEEQEAESFLAAMSSLGGR